MVRKISPAPVPRLSVGSSVAGSLLLRPTVSVPPYFDVRADAGPSRVRRTTAMAPTVTPRRLLLLLTSPPLTHTQTTQGPTLRAACQHAQPSDSPSVGPPTGLVTLSGSA